MLQKKAQLKHYISHKRCFRKCNTWLFMAAEVRGKEEIANETPGH